jgi:hypothetical protein
MWSMYFIYSYKNRTMKPIKIISSKEEVVKENYDGDESNQGTV